METTEIKKILIIGKFGQVGHELQHGMSMLGKVKAIDFGEIDLADEANIRSVVRENKPDILVNAAAYTNVDKAEEEKELAFKINSDAARVLAQEMNEREGLLVHYSTDFVFNGKKKSPYTETDEPCPINVYGESKLAGDESIIKEGGKFLILRTSWVYGLRGKNFLLTILRLTKDRDSLNVIDDQIGSPTWSRAIADGTTLLCQKYLNNSGNSFKDIVNFNAGGETTWCGFAKAIIENAKQTKNPCLKLNKDFSIKPIPTEEYPTPAERPKYSVLSKDKLLKNYQIVMPNWRDQLDLCMAH